MSNRTTPATAPAPTATRLALREAIITRDEATELLSLAQQAERRSLASLQTAETKLGTFKSVDNEILAYRSGRIKDAAKGGGPEADLKLPTALVERRAARDEAQERVTANRSAHDSLVTEVAQAQRALERAERSVGDAATAIMLEEARLISAAFVAAWSNVWHLYDTLSALPGPYQQLPGDAVRIMRMLPGIDHRQWTAAGNPARTRAKERWQAWLAALLKDADAAAPELTDDGASVAPVGRVA